jgi:endonuclease/exonuclease/phosphatase family metal-dependent hydrolase
VISYKSSALALCAVVLAGLGCQASFDLPKHQRAAGENDRDRIALSAVADLRPTRVSADISDRLKRSFDATAKPLSVLTFNMEHRDKPKELAVMAKHLKQDLTRLPDFILLQEVVFNRGERKGQDNTAEVLGDQLGYHTRGTKRNGDKEGIAIASKYSFAHYEELRLEAQTSRFLLGFNRVSVMGEFQVPGIGRVRVVNVHFTNWEFESHIRTRQLKETLEWTAARNREVPADLIFFGGDFNIEPDWSELDLVFDAKQALGLEFQDFNTTNPTHGSTGKPRHRVDYIFVCAPTHGVKMNGEQRLFAEGLKTDSGKRFHLSDHVPVLHEYDVRVPDRPKFVDRLHAGASPTVANP